MFHLFALYYLFFIQKFYLIPVEALKNMEITISEPLTGIANAEKTDKNKAEAKKLAEESGEFEGLIDRLEETEDWRGSLKESYDQIIANNGAPGSYIQRYRKYEDIVVRDVFPTINAIDRPIQSQLKNAPRRLEQYEKRNKIIEKFRKGDFSEVKIDPPEGKRGNNDVPLVFPKDERSIYFDHTLTLPKEDQLQKFSDKYLQYNKEKGDLPEAIRDLYYKNLQRIAYTFSHDPTYFAIDYYQENLNKEDFLIHSMDFVSRFADTKASVEMLFALENIYEIQMRAWQQFFRYKKEKDSIPEELHQQEIRIATLDKVDERYSKVLEKLELKDYNDIAKLYYQRRLELVEEILAHPKKYRRKDALFEEGRIHWDNSIQFNDEEERRKALEIWKKISSAPSSGDFLNKETYETLKKILPQGNEKLSRGQVASIERLMRTRFQKQMEEKIEREKELLYPK